jgi:hypothetical protein
MQHEDSLYLGVRRTAPGAKNSSLALHPGESGPAMSRRKKLWSGLIPDLAGMTVARHDLPALKVNIAGLCAGWIRKGLSRVGLRCPSEGTLRQ